MNFCNYCKTDKPISEFYPSVKSECKACRRSKAAPLREAKKQYLREWRAKNPGAYKKWSEANAERKSASWREWYEKNKDHRAKSYAKWAKENKHIINSIVAKRNAAKMMATPPWADFAAIRAIYAEAASLTAETGVRHEVDHFYPLQGETVCGLHCEANLQILTKVENIRKKNRMPIAA